MQLSVLINYGIYGFIAVLALFGAIGGLVNGIRRQTLRTVSIAISAVLSFFISAAVYPTVFSLLKGKTVSELLASFGIKLADAFVNILNNVEMETGIYLLAIPLALAVVPLLFILLFVLINLIMLIPYAIFSGIFGFTKKYNNFLTRILGAVLGLVQGAVVAAVILIPIAGTLGTVSSAVKAAESEHPDSANTVAIANVYHQNLDAVESNLVIKLLNERCGFVYNKLITVEVEGEDVNMSSVVADSLELFVLYGDLGGADFNHLSAENKTTISSMVEGVGDDTYISTLLSGLLRAVAGAFDSGAVAFNFEEPILSFMNSFMHVFATTETDTVEGDVNTTKNIYFILSDSGLLGADSDGGMFDSLSSADKNQASIMTHIVTELNKNPRFRPVATELSNMSVYLLLKSKGVEGDATEVVSELTNDLNEVIAIDKNDYETEEEYREEVSTSIHDALDTHGIALNESQLEEVTDFVITEFDGKEEITEAEFADFMAKYYDIYSKQTSSDIPEAA